MMLTGCLRSVISPDRVILSTLLLSTVTIVLSLAEVAAMTPIIMMPSNPNKNTEIHIPANAPSMLTKNCFIRLNIID